MGNLGTKLIQEMMDPGFKNKLISYYKEYMTLNNIDKLTPEHKERVSNYVADKMIDSAKRRNIHGSTTPRN